jgi:hypothetical protein
MEKARNATILANHMRGSANRGGTVAALNALTLVYPHVKGLSLHVGLSQHCSCLACLPAYITSKA